MAWEDALYDEAVGPPSPHAHARNPWEWLEDVELSAIELRVSWLQEAQARAVKAANAQKPRRVVRHPKPRPKPPPPVRQPVARTRAIEADYERARAQGRSPKEIDVVWFERAMKLIRAARALQNEDRPRADRIMLGAVGALELAYGEHLVHHVETATPQRVECECGWFRWTPEPL